MRFLSVCAGVEAASVAWEPLNWQTAAVSEIAPFPRAVLAHRFPNTPLHGDFTTIGADDYGAIDLLVRGTPCQSFSIGGLRGGLDDDRGNLALEYLRLADRKRPRWLVWENVPGALSTNSRRDFGAFLRGLEELGFGFAYRVLDARYFGVAQRRRRLIVVGYRGDWRRAGAVLFERASLARDLPPRAETRDRKPYYATSCGDLAPTLAERDYKGPSCGRDGFVGILIADARGIRKATPREYERLQGFPDDWTLVPYRGRPAEQCPDGPRYSALGNSMPVPLMAWIGRRIAAVDARA